MNAPNFKEQIYRDYKNKVAGYLYQRIGNPTEVEDLVSEVFVKIYSKLDTFDDSKASLSTWIYHITQNTLTDFYRKHKILNEIPEDASDEKEDLQDSVANEDMLESLASALEKLDETSRDLIILYYYKNITLKEIAEKLGISYIYAKVLHKKALDKLKGVLG